VLILSSIQLSALHLDLPKAQQHPLICLDHTDVRAGNQGHGHDHLNQPKPPLTAKVGCMELHYGWLQSAYWWFLHASILRGMEANFYQAIRLFCGKSAAALPLLPPALKIAAYAYIFIRHFSCPARQSLLDPGDYC
jgi:hypothetical protein